MIPSRQEGLMAKYMYGTKKKKAKGKRKKK